MEYNTRKCLWPCNNFSKMCDACDRWPCLLLWARLLWDNDVLEKKSPIEQINKQKGAQEINVVWPLVPNSTTSQINPLIFVKKIQSTI